jgi:hypothetical protein
MRTGEFSPVTSDRGFYCRRLDKCQRRTLGCICSPKDIPCALSPDVGVEQASLTHVEDDATTERLDL